MAPTFIFGSPFSGNAGCKIEHGQLTPETDHGSEQEDSLKSTWNPVYELGVRNIWSGGIRCLGHSQYGGRCPWDMDDDALRRRTPDIKELLDRLSRLNPHDIDDDDLEELLDLGVCNIHGSRLGEAKAGGMRDLRIRLAAVQSRAAEPEKSDPNEQITRLRNGLYQKSIAAEKYKIEIEKLEENRRKLEAKLESAETKIEDMKVLSQEKQQQLEAITTERDQQQATINATNQKYVSCKKESQRLLNLVENNEGMLQSKVEQVTTSISKIERLAQQQQARVNELEIVYKHRSTELDATKTKNLELEKSWRKQSNHLIWLEAECATQKIWLQARDARIHELERSHQEQKIQLEQCAKDHAKQQADLEAAMSQIDELQTASEEKQGEIDHLNGVRAQQEVKLKTGKSKLNEKIIFVGQEA